MLVGVPAVATRGCQPHEEAGAPLQHSRPSPWLTHSERRPGLAWRQVFAGALDAASLQRWHRRKALKVREDRQGGGGESRC